MSWQTNTVAMRMRRLARNLGFTRILGSLLSTRNYEAAFDEAIFAAITPGDMIWDVGANIGYYTAKFADATGPQGHVFAFEPFPATVARLRDAVSSYANVTILPKALGSRCERVVMEGGQDELRATSRILAADEGAGIAVEVQTGDDVLTTAKISAPSILKIDTEGFELDVLEGMSELLTNPVLRAIYIEVHFALLEKRGFAQAPSWIEQRLQDAGFETRWVDPSHIVATRSTT